MEWNRECGEHSEHPSLSSDSGSRPAAGNSGRWASMEAKNRRSLGHKQIAQPPGHDEA